MKCIIIAAGYATRLYPLTENYPKPLLDVGGKPILDHLIADVESMADEFIVVTNHKFTKVFEGWASDKKKVKIIDDMTTTNDTRLGAVKEIQLAAKDIEGDVLVMAGDNLLGFSLKDFIDFAKQKKASCVMCHEENDLKKKQKTAIITIDQNNRVLTYEEKPKEPKGKWAVPPFYVYRYMDIMRIQEALDEGCGYDAPGSFAAWLSRKTPMYAYIMPGRRYDIGDIESYERVKKIYFK